MSLVKYKSKRNFNKTPEPTSSKKGKTKQLVFVIQRHQASHLHYDFRLEMEGVLKSWAVPKGPSLNPEDKRLAMMVEDHPYDYRTFEGVIPEGNYGAGVVEIWDEGTYEHIEEKDPTQGEKQLLKDLKAGSIKIVLHGKRLQGEFALVKIKSDPKGNAWLLIKHNDQYAVHSNYVAEEHTDPDSAVTAEVKRRKSSRKTRSSEEPEKKKSGIKHVLAQLGKEKKYTDFLSPMLAKIGEAPFSDKEWIFEVKWDGYRAIAELKNGNVKLHSRNGLAFEDKYFPVVEALSKLKDDMILDGEVVVLDEKGNPNFQLLQHYSETHEQYELVYYVFDLLFYRGKELFDTPLLERKKLLKKVLPKEGNIRYSEHVEAEGKKFFDWAKSKNLEGIMAKKADSHYYPNKRTSEWLKIRNHNIQEAVITGFTPPQGARKHFGSLILGIYEHNELKYAGHVGTGFDDQSLEDLHQQMTSLETAKSPFQPTPKEEKKGVRWIKPVLVCNIKYTEWTKDRQLRHPVFMGLRIDKEPQELQKDNDAMETKSSTRKSKSSSSKDKEIVSVGGKKVSLTNQGKLYFPEDGITKGDVVEYYQSIASYILPYLKDRPESLKRNPNGIQDQGFYHKDAGDEAPSWVKSFEVYSESNHKNIDYILCNDKATLMYLNNLGCIEINPWNSRISKLDYPDYMVIDIDPSDNNTFDEVVETSLFVKEVLDKAGADCYCKTSGATGLHVYIPMGAKYTYDQVKIFAQIVATAVEEQLPFTTLERSLSKRGNRIYVDYLQNRTGQTLSSVYSLRPKKGGTVSTPLEWSEVKKGISPQQFTLHNILERLEKKGDLFKPVLGKGIDMEKCLDMLQR